jgi:hypothetical protein
MAGCNGDVLIQLEVKDLTRESFDLLTTDPNTRMVTKNEWTWNPFEKNSYPKAT